MFWRFLPVPRRQDRWLQPKSALWCRTGPTHRVLTRSQVCPPSSSCVNLPSSSSSSLHLFTLLSRPPSVQSVSLLLRLLLSALVHAWLFGREDVLISALLVNFEKLLIEVKKKKRKREIKYYSWSISMIKKHDWNGFILGLLKNLKQIQQAWNSTRHWKNPKCFKILWAHSHFTQRRETRRVICAHDAHDHIQKIAEDAEHIHAWFCCTNKTSLLVSYGCWRVLTNQRQHETSAIFSWT